MSKITFSKARRGFADLLGRVRFGGERVVISRHGRPQVAVIPLGDFELLMNGLLAKPEVRNSAAKRRARPR